CVARCCSPCLLFVFATLSVFCYCFVFRRYLHSFPTRRSSDLNSGQRLPPTYYRGCWHVVSRGFLVRYRQGTDSYSGTCSSLTTELYDPKIFIAHAALLRQTFVHCGRFPTAASRRSLGRVSVPVWPITLSGRLRI